MNLGIKITILDVQPFVFYSLVNNRIIGDDAKLLDQGRTDIACQYSKWTFRIPHEKVTENFIKMACSRVWCDDITAGQQLLWFRQGQLPSLLGRNKSSARLLSDETDSILLAHALLTRAFGTRRREPIPIYDTPPWYNVTPLHNCIVCMDWDT